VLNDGFVTVDKIMYDDSDIVRIARVTTAKSKKKFNSDEKLLTYLYKEGHSSPFNFPEIILLVRAPLFVREQWFRHRTGTREEIFVDNGWYVDVESTDQQASQYSDQQQFSGRYAQYDGKFYLPPEDWFLEPSATNHQASSNKKLANASSLREAMLAQQTGQFSNYNDLIDAGLARERARINLPLATYSEWFWKQDLWNTLDWLKKRRHPSAQLEIVAYAKIIEKIVEEYFPLTYKAWLNVVDGVQLTRDELLELREAITGCKLNEPLARKLGVG